MARKIEYRRAQPSTDPRIQPAAVSRDPRIQPESTARDPRIEWDEPARPAPGEVVTARVARAAEMDPRVQPAAWVLDSRIKQEAPPPDARIQTERKAPHPRANPARSTSVGGSAVLARPVPVGTLVAARHATDTLATQATQTADTAKTEVRHGLARNDLPLASHRTTGATLESPDERSPGGGCNECHSTKGREFVPSEVDSSNRPFAEARRSSREIRLTVFRDAREGATESKLFVCSAAMQPIAPQLSALTSRSHGRRLIQQLALDAAQTQAGSAHLPGASRETPRLRGPSPLSGAARVSAEVGQRQGSTLFDASRYRDLTGRTRLSPATIPSFVATPAVSEVRSARRVVLTPGQQSDRVDGQARYFWDVFTDARVVWRIDCPALYIGIGADGSVIVHQHNSYDRSANYAAVRSVIPNYPSAVCIAHSAAMGYLAEARAFAGGNREAFESEHSTRVALEYVLGEDGTIRLTQYDEFLSLLLRDDVIVRREYYISLIYVLSASCYTLPMRAQLLRDLQRTSVRITADQLFLQTGVLVVNQHPLHLGPMQVVPDGFTELDIESALTAIRVVPASVRDLARVLEFASGDIIGGQGTTTVSGVVTIAQHDTGGEPAQTLFVPGIPRERWPQRNTFQLAIIHEMGHSVQNTSRDSWIFRRLQISSPGFAAASPSVQSTGWYQEDFAYSWGDFFENTAVWIESITTQRNPFLNLKMALVLDAMSYEHGLVPAYATSPFSRSVLATGPLGSVQRTGYLPYRRAPQSVPGSPIPGPIDRVGNFDLPVADEAISLP